MIYIAGYNSWHERVYVVNIFISGIAIKALPFRDLCRENEWELEERTIHQFISFFICTTDLISNVCKSSKQTWRYDPHDAKQQNWNKSAANDLD